MKQTKDDLELSLKRLEIAEKKEAVKRLNKEKQKCDNSRVELEKIDKLRSLLESFRIESPDGMLSEPRFERVFNDADEMVIKNKLFEIISNL